MATLIASLTNQLVYNTSTYGNLYLNFYLYYDGGRAYVNCKIASASKMVNPYDNNSYSYNFNDGTSSTYVWGKHNINDSEWTMFYSGYNYGEGSTITAGFYCWNKSTWRTISGTVPYSTRSLSAVAKDYISSAWPSSSSVTPGSSASVDCTVQSSTTQYTYSFSHWTDGSSTVSYSKNYSFTMPTSNYTLYAYGTRSLNYYTISPAKGDYISSVSGGGSTGYGNTTTLSCTVQSSTTQYSYSFLGWYNSSGTRVSTSTSYSPTCYGNATYTAKASRSLNYYTITPSAGSYISSVSGGGSTGYGNTTTLSCTVQSSTAKYTYTFDGWYNSSGTRVSTSTTYSPTCYGTATYTAKATRTLNYYTITPKAGAHISSVSGGGSIGYDNTTTLSCVVESATEKETYVFDGWYDSSDNLVSTSTSYTVTCTGAATYTARASVKVNQYTVTINTNGKEGTQSKTVDYGTTYESNNDSLLFSDGQSVTVTIPDDTPKTQYFEPAAWNPSTGTVIDDTTIDAIFSNSSIYYTVTFCVNGNNTQTASVTYETTYTTSGNIITFNQGKEDEQVITIEKPNDTEQWKYSDDCKWGSESGTIIGDTTIKVDFDATVQVYTIDIKTNGTIEGTTVSEKKLEIPYGVTYSVKDNTITFNKLEQYASFKTVNEEYFTVKNDDATYSQFEVLVNGGHYEGDSVTVVKPEDSSEFKYKDIASWDVFSGQVMADITITATFKSDTQDCEVIIKTNDESQTQTFSIPYGTEYSVDVDKNTITFSNGQNATLTPPTDDNRHKYNSTADWSSTSGTIKGDTTISAIFGYTPKYAVNITTNGSGEQSLYILENTTYETNGDEISFSDGQSVIIKIPDDTQKWKYYDEVEWTPSSGTITEDCTVHGEFKKEVKYYSFTLDTNSKDGSKTVSLPYDTTYEVTVNDNIIIFNDESGTKINEIQIVKPDDDNTRKYDETAVWSVDKGTITADINASAIFGYTPKYAVGIATNGSGSTTLYIPENTTFLVTGNKIEFSDSQFVEVKKPSDAGSEWKYSDTAEWDVESGTITEDTTINANFSATRKGYDVIINTVADDEIIKTTTINVFYGNSFSTENNKIEFTDGQIIEVEQPKDDDRHQYKSTADWNPSSGLIYTDTTINAVFNFTPKYEVTIETNGFIEDTEEQSKKIIVLSGTSFITTSEEDNNRITFGDEQTTYVTKPKDTDKSKYYSIASWFDEKGTITEDTTVKAIFYYLPEYDVNIESNEGIVQTLKIVSGTTYTTTSEEDNNTITFSDGQTVKVDKPEDTDEWKYNTCATWSSTEGSIIKETTISGIFEREKQKYIVTINTNDGIKEELTVAYGVTYTTNNNIITFSDKQELEVYKPIDTDEKKYNKYTTWTPLSGAIIGVTSIDAIFEYTPKYKITITTNGTFKGADTSSRTLIVVSGTSYQTSDNTITFYDDETTSFELIKPVDSVDMTYSNAATWNYSGGTIKSSITINGNFASSVREYDISIKSNGIFEDSTDGYHEIILSIPYGSTYITTVENDKNCIKFTYNGVTNTYNVTKPDLTYTNKVNWEPSSGSITGDTEEAINKNIVGNFIPKGFESGEVEILDKYTLEYATIDEETGVITVTPPTNFKGRVMKLYVSLYYIGDEPEKTREENFLVRWKLSVFDRLYIKNTNNGYTYVDTMPEDGDWYTTGPTIIKIDGEQRYFHVETGTTEGDIEEINDFPSLPGYIEGEFYKAGDGLNVCEPIEYSLTTFIGDYTKEERDEISTQIVLGNYTFNCRKGTLERYYPEGFEETRKVSVSADDTEKLIVSGTGTYNYGTSVTISATPISGNGGYLFSHWNDGNTDNPRVIERLTEDMSFVAYATRVFGVEKVYDADNSDWDRTNGAVGFTANATHDGSAVVNDFDTIYPWSDIITVNIKDDEIVAKYGDENFKFDGTNGDVMTYIPKHYYRRYVEEQKEHIQIAKDPFTGSKEISSFYISRYPMSDGCESKSGILGQVSKTLEEFRDEISTTKGDKWSQMDWRMFAIQNLYLVEYASGESQETLGYGVSKIPAWIVDSKEFKHFEPWTGWNEEGTELEPYTEKAIYDSYTKKTRYIHVPPDPTSYQVENGECDSLGMKSGCIVNDGLHSVIYRGIENPFGNIWCFVDGINIKNFKVFVSFDHTKYKSRYYRGSYKRLNYLASIGEGTPTENGYDNLYPIISIPASTNSTKTDGYYWRDTGERILISGGHWYNNTLGEIFTLSANYTPDTKRFDVGTRLMRDCDEENEDE